MTVLEIFHISTYSLIISTIRFLPINADCKIGSPNACNRNGQCFLDGKVTQCDCLKQYFDGPTCKKTVKPCSWLRCNKVNTKKCHNYYGNYFCECKAGYHGRHCTLKQEKLRVKKPIERPGVWVQSETKVGKKSRVVIVTGDWHDTDRMEVIVAGRLLRFAKADFIKYPPCPDAVEDVIEVGDISTEHKHCWTESIEFLNRGFQFSEIHMLNKFREYLYEWHSENDYYFEYYVGKKSGETKCIPEIEFVGGACSQGYSFRPKISYMLSYPFALTVTAGCQNSEISLPTYTATYFKESSSENPPKLISGDDLSPTGKYIFNKDAESETIALHTFKLTDLMENYKDDYEYDRLFYWLDTTWTIRVKYTETPKNKSSPFVAGSNYAYCYLQNYANTIPFVVSYQGVYFPVAINITASFTAKYSFMLPEYDPERYDDRWEAKLNKMMERNRMTYARLPGNKYDYKIMPDCKPANKHCGVDLTLKKTGRPPPDLTSHLNHNVQLGIKVAYRRWIFGMWGKKKAPLDVKNPSTYQVAPSDESVETITIWDAGALPMNEIHYVKCLQNCWDNRPVSDGLSDRKSYIVLKVDYDKNGVLYTGQCKYLFTMTDVYDETYKSTTDNNKYRAFVEHNMGRDYLIIDPRVIPHNRWRMTMDFTGKISDVTDKAIFHKCLYTTQKFGFALYSKMSELKLTTTRHVNRCKATIQASPFPLYPHLSRYLQPVVLCYDDFDMSYPTVVLFWQKVTEFPTENGILIGYSFSPELTCLLAASFSPILSVQFFVKNYIFDATLTSALERHNLAKTLPERLLGPRRHVSAIIKMALGEKEGINSLAVDIEFRNTFSFVQKAHFLLVEFVNAQFSGNADENFFAQQQFANILENALLNIAIHFHSKYVAVMQPFDSIMMSTILDEMVMKLKSPFSPEQVYVIGTASRVLAALFLNAMSMEFKQNLQIAECIGRLYIDILFRLSQPQVLEEEMKTRRHSLMNTEMQIVEDEETDEHYEYYIDDDIQVITAGVEKFKEGLAEGHIAARMGFTAIIDHLYPILISHENAKQRFFTKPIQYTHAHYEYYGYVADNTTHLPHSVGNRIKIIIDDSFFESLRYGSCAAGIMLMEYYFQPFWFLPLGNYTNSGSLTLRLFYLTEKKKSKTKRRSPRAADFKDVPKIPADYEKKYFQSDFTALYPIQSDPRFRAVGAAIAPDEAFYYYYFPLDGFMNHSIIAFLFTSIFNGPLKVHLSHSPPTNTGCVYEKENINISKPFISIPIENGENKSVYACVARNNTDTHASYKFYAFAIVCLMWSPNQMNKYQLTGELGNENCTDVQMIVIDGEAYAQCNCKTEKSSLYTVSIRPLQPMVVGTQLFSINFEPISTGLIAPSIHYPIPAVYTSILLFMIFAVLFLLAYILDSQCVETPYRYPKYLCTNRNHERYLYVIVVVSRSGTTSCVGLRLIGSYQNSQRHILNGIDSKCYCDTRRIQFYALTTSGFVGNIRAVDIWTDYRGPTPAWFLEKIIVRDYCMRKEWPFMVKKWFKLGGRRSFIHRTISQQKSERTVECRCGYMFNMAQFRPQHLFFGMLMRDHCYAFTRCSKVVVALALLSVAMLMPLLYNNHLQDYLFTEKGREEPLTVGTDIGYGLAGILFAVVIVYPILYVIKNSNPNKTSIRYYCICEDYSTKPPAPLYKYQFKHRLYAWILLAFIITLCLCLMTAAAATIHPDAYDHWLVSIITVLVVEILIVETVHVAVRQLIMMKYFPNDFRRYSNEIILFPDYREEIEILQNKGMKHYIFKDMLFPVPYRLRKILTRKEDEFGLCSQFLTLMFLLGILLLALLLLMGTCHYPSYMSRRVIDSMLVKDRYYRYTNILHVLTIQELVQSYYMKTVLSNVHFYTPTFMVASNWQVLGVIRIRQHRIKPFYYLCENIDEFIFTMDCNPEFSESNMDTNSYLADWAEWNETEYKKLPRKLSAYQYERPFAADRYPGVFHVPVPGGGYMIDLSRNIINSKVMLKYYMKQKWIDYKTRLLIVEVNAYNVHSKDLAIFKMFTHISSTGDIIHIPHTIISKFCGDSTYEVGMRLNLIAFVIITIVVFLFWLVYSRITYQFPSDVPMYAYNLIIDVLLLICGVATIVLILLWEVTMRRLSDLYRINYKINIINIDVVAHFAYVLRIVVGFFIFFVLLKVLPLLTFIYPIRVIVFNFSIVFSLLFLLLCSMLLYVLSCGLPFSTFYGSHIHQAHSSGVMNCFTFLLGFNPSLDQYIFNEWDKYGQFIVMISLRIFYVFILRLFCAIFVYGYRRATVRLYGNYYSKFPLILFIKERVLHVPGEFDGKRR